VIPSLKPAPQAAGKNGRYTLKNTNMRTRGASERRIANQGLFCQAKHLPKAFAVPIAAAAKRTAF
jgi:hypothetical protein